MTEPGDIEARLAAVEAKVEIAAADALVARHLAAAGDRDIADVGVKVDANRRAINALGEQTAARFDRLQTDLTTLGEQTATRFDRLETEMQDGFADVRGRLDQTATRADRLQTDLTTLGEQTATRFDRLQTEMQDGFADVRGRLDQTSAGQQRIVDILAAMIDPPRDD